MEDPDPKLQVWRAARAQEPEALKELSTLSCRVARRELQRRGAPADAVEGLVQEVAASVLAFLRSGGEVRTNLEGFLKYRTLGVLSELYRRRGSTRDEVSFEEAGEPASAVRSPVADAHRAELGQALRDCMLQLKQKLREAVEMRYFRMMETRRIAGVLGIEPSTVNVRVFRAMGLLRECLRGRGFAELQD